MLIITVLMINHLIYNHSSCVWMVNSLHRCAHNMLCKFHLKCFHCKWNIEYMCKHSKESERRVLYIYKYSFSMYTCVDLYIYICFVLYCFLHVYCVHVKFTLQYNGGNKYVHCIHICIISMYKYLNCL